MNALEAEILVEETQQALAPNDARQLTDRIRQTLEFTWDLIVHAYQGQAWTALGYASWNDYVVKEFGNQHLAIPREDRQEVVSSLRESGLSIRAIAAATNLSYGTVSRTLGDASTDPDGSVDENEVAPRLDKETSNYQAIVEDAPEVEERSIRGMNGKKYRPTQARKHPREEDSNFDDSPEVGGIFPISADEVISKNAKARVQNVQRLTGSNGKFAQAPLPLVINLAGQIAHTSAGADELDVEETTSLADNSSRAVLVLSQVLKTVDAAFILDRATKAKIQANLNDAQNVIHEVLDALESGA